MKRLKRLLFILLMILLTGYLLPQHLSMPVKGATKESYDQKSFRAYPWGSSITHKGVDIFAPEGTDVLASTGGLVVFTGVLTKGGNALIILGPKWRFHYYAHLKEIKTKRFAFVKRNNVIGLVGTTGNAVGKPPHLHYSIKSMLPLPWKKDESIQGWKKMFYLNPVVYLNESCN
ncbi:MAG: M23 family metallopeptidase [Chitinophagaceae bacterium]|nr:M23 family metallopeptidase [Chitinophagaceae bacterium]